MLEKGEVESNPPTKPDARARGKVTSPCAKAESQLVPVQVFHANPHTLETVCLGFILTDVQTPAAGDPSVNRRDRPGERQADDKDRWEPGP